MTLSPLTHHDILALVAPFSRRGRQVDLAASDRAQRRIVFKSLSHAAAGPDRPALVESLALEKLSASRFRLTRLLTLDGGAQARLEVSGRDPGALLGQVESAPLARHFQFGEGFVVARDHVLSDSVVSAGPVLTRGVVHLAGLRLTLSVPAVRSVSAETLLTAVPGLELDIPQDLLAVLGWNWSPLDRTPQGWAGKYRLRGSPDQRTRRAEQALARAAEHLAQVLAQPPQTFHIQCFWARWRVLLRRGIPVLTPILILLTLWIMPPLDMGDQPGLWTLFYHLPTALIALSFMFQDMPRFEIPPWPRRLRQDAWVRPAARGAADVVRPPSAAP